MKKKLITMLTLTTTLVSAGVVVSCFNSNNKPNIKSENKDAPYYLKEKAPQTLINKNIRLDPKKYDELVKKRVDSLKYMGKKYNDYVFEAKGFKFYFESKLSKHFLNNKPSAYIEKLLKTFLRYNLYTSNEIITFNFEAMSRTNGSYIHNRHEAYIYRFNDQRFHKVLYTMFHEYQHALHDKITMPVFTKNFFDFLGHFNPYSNKIIKWFNNFDPGKQYKTSQKVDQKITNVFGYYQKRNYWWWDANYSFKWNVVNKRTGFTELFADYILFFMGDNREKDADNEWDKIETINHYYNWLPIYPGVEGTKGYGYVAYKTIGTYLNKVLGIGTKNFFKISPNTKGAFINFHTVGTDYAGELDHIELQYDNKTIKIPVSEDEVAIGFSDEPQAKLNKYKYVAKRSYILNHQLNNNFDIKKLGSAKLILVKKDGTKISDQKENTITFPDPIPFSSWNWSIMYYDKKDSIYKVEKPI